MTYFWSSKTRLTSIALVSVSSGSSICCRSGCSFCALNAFAPFLANLALAPLAILAGLLPLTFAGIGTRDAALVFLYRPYFDAPTAAALGLLCTARYILPALAGLPFAGKYFARTQSQSSAM